MPVQLNDILEKIESESESDNHDDLRDLNEMSVDTDSCYADSDEYF